jgi:hypothetical protein
MFSPNSTLQYTLKPVLVEDEFRRALYGGDPPPVYSKHVTPVHLGIYQLYNEDWWGMLDGKYVDVDQT